MKPLPMKTVYQQLVEDWRECTRCPLHETRNRVVLSRGKVPCDVLFVGEAPGISEDVLGRPFVGPAGHLLDRIIERAFTGPTGGQRYRYCLTNLVACIPIDIDGKKASEPEDDHVKTCGDRLIRMVEICRPRLIVCVGKLAKDWLDQEYKQSIKIPKLPDGRPIPQVHIEHPAYLLRLNVALRGLGIQRCGVILSNALDDLDEEESKHGVPR